MLASKIIIPVLIVVANNTEMYYKHGFSPDLKLYCFIGCYYRLEMHDISFNMLVSAGVY